LPEEDIFFGLVGARLETRYNVLRAGHDLSLRKGREAIKVQTEVSQGACKLEDANLREPLQIVEGEGRVGPVKQHYHDSNKGHM
jgi:hypothetical protein